MRAEKVLLVTGSSGLIGSEVAKHFHDSGWSVHGVDNNQRAVFFGPSGDTRWNQQRMESTLERFVHHEVDVRDRAQILELVATVSPDAIVHTAAQPSHDRAAAIPFDDFDTNAVGTLNLLEAVRRYAKESPFVHMSTNKVYGDAPNEIPLVETETRWDYQDPRYTRGIPETFRIDQSKHSLFGASKVAADVMVQEYGRYFDMPTCCLRGGCLTGPAHSGVELHRKVHPRPPLRRGLQSRWRTRQQLFCARVVHPCRGSHRPQVAMDLRRRKSSGRPHLLLFRSIKNERALSRMGNNEEPR
jgi:CDP-paratose 2-epimerase